MAAGARSGREWNAHMPFGGSGETLGRGQTFVARRGPSSGTCKDLSLEDRPSSSQPTVFAKRRQVAPAPSALRKRRRVNLELITKPYSTRERIFALGLALSGRLERIGRNLVRSRLC